MELTYYSLDALNILLQLRRDGKIGWRAFGLGTVIASFANKDTGEAWPLRATLSRITGIDMRDISRTVRELEAAKFMTVSGRGGQANIYCLTLGRFATPGDSATLGDLPPTPGDLASKNLGDLPPITIEEQSNNNKVDIARPATTFTAASKAGKPSVAAERETIATQIDALYRKSVPNPYNRKLPPKKSIPRIVAILKSGVSEDELTGAIRRYAKEAAKAPPDKRKGIRGFFSPRDGMWEGYAAEDDSEGTAEGNIDPGDAWEATPQMLADYEEFCQQNRERDGLVLVDGKLIKKGDAHERSDAVAGTA